MEERENRRTQMTRMLLKTSLIELLQGKELRHITIKEICENADLNRSTFYLHYTDQYMLLAEIEHDITEQTNNYLEKVDSDTDGVTYLKIFLDYIRANEKIFRILLCGQEDTSFKTSFIQNTLEQIKQSRPPVCPKGVEKYVYNFIIYGCIYIIIEWIQSDFEVDSKLLAGTIFRVSDSVLGGVQ